MSRCQTCGGLGQVRDYCSDENCDDPHCTLVTLHCPDCTPENVETRCVPLCGAGDAPWWKHGALCPARKETT